MDDFESVCPTTKQTFNLELDLRRSRGLLLPCHVLFCNEGGRSDSELGAAWYYLVGWNEGRGFRRLIRKYSYNRVAQREREILNAGASDNRLIGRKRSKIRKRRRFDSILSVDFSAWAKGQSGARKRVAVEPALIGRASQSATLLSMRFCSSRSRIWNGHIILQPFGHPSAAVLRRRKPRKAGPLSFEKKTLKLLLTCLTVPSSFFCDRIDYGCSIPYGFGFRLQSVFRRMLSFGSPFVSNRNRIRIGVGIPNRKYFSNNSRVRVMIQRRFLEKRSKVWGNFFSLCLIV